MRDFCLLDYLSWKLGLPYLSEIRSLSAAGRWRLGYILEAKTHLADFPEAE